MILKKKQKGSALIIALLMMGILMTLALGLSDLVIRETIITRDFVNSQKAFYAAEAGIESALLDLHQYLPGYDNVLNPSGEKNTDLKLDYSYTIKNRTQVIPHVNTKLIAPEIASGAPQKYLYNVLNLNESITIPLFYNNNEGKEIPVKSFRVEYFIDAEINPLFAMQGYNTEKIPMLRWKITGIKKGLNLNNPTVKKSFYTESIGDYLGVMENSGASMPSCLGTGDDKAKDSLNIDGINYSYNCNRNIWTCAREAYRFDIVNGELTTIRNSSTSQTNCAGNAYQISDFIAGTDKHEKNYLTISNIFNPAVLAGFADVQKKSAKIYYRILITGDKEYTVPQVAEISSTGFLGKLRHGINAFIQSQSFLPVFNYSLYRTDTDANKESPAGKNA